MVSEVNIAKSLDSLMKVEYYMKVKGRDNHLLFDHIMKRETLENIIKD